MPRSSAGNRMTPQLPTQTETAITVMLKWLISFFVSIWVTIPLVIQTLFILSVVDILTGFFSPNHSFEKAIRRVCLALILVCTLKYAFFIAKDQANFSLGFDVATAVCTYYILNEILIIIRNCADGGLSIPPWLISILEKAEGAIGPPKKQETVVVTQSVVIQKPPESEKSVIITHEDIKK